MLNKRGQEMSTNTIILVILGVIVLVVLILGFTLGWDRIVPWVFSKNNVNTIVSVCGAACGTQSAYDFCVFERTLKAEDLPGGVKEVKGTCNYFATEKDEQGELIYVKYGINDCPGLCSETSE